MSRTPLNERQNAARRVGEKNRLVSLLTEEPEDRFNFREISFIEDMRIAAVVSDKNLARLHEIKERVCSQSVSQTA